MLIGRLFDGPVDIVGDVHGESEALRILMERLGYAPDGQHPQGRRLVFLGDLTDRGPDSPAVVECVMGLVQANRAQCILGNHELNLLLGQSKTGNHWFYGKSEPDFPSKPATETERKRYLDFFRTLPLALERPDLRVVHACWHDEALSQMSGHTDAAKACHEQTNRFRQETNSSGLAARASVGWKKIAARVKDPTPPGPAFDPDVARYQTLEQMAVPVKVITSGEESETDPDKVYWSSGKWRMNNRVPWWNTRQLDRPVIVGHYWRQSDAQNQDKEKGQPDLFDGLPASSWLGEQKRVFCVDFSVGRRFVERANGRTQGPFATQLGALRIPEWTVFFDNREPMEIGPPG